MTREEILARFTGEDKMLAARVFDWALEAMRQNDCQLSDFLDPRELDLVLGILKQFPGLLWHAFGGYRGAERKRVAIVPDFFPEEELAWQIGAVEIRGEFEDDPPNHRDYLGALLNLGLRREKLGDILVSPQVCHVLTTEELVPYISQELKRVGRWHVTAQPFDLERLTPPQQQKKQIRTTVASMRLDALASAGFGLSRTKVVRLIRAGLVKVNWEQALNPDKTLAQRDVISLRGKGRVLVAEVGGLTKKKRQYLVLERYL
ncbi:MAG TPA: YlmH/Sll1252 family protein [Bacillota bacterium]|nr:YlmH/Sll1252 family protein [Bacillota bacterium]